jgi:hypothetical protein
LIAQRSRIASSRRSSASLNAAGPEGAAVLERVRHVAQVRLRSVVHRRGEDVVGVAPALLDELARCGRRVLGRRHAIHRTVRPMTSDTAGGERRACTSTKSR